MPTTADGLRRVALQEFAAAGFHGTSLQQIAQRAGVSKATVLYHFASKEVLLEAVLSPALDELERILHEVGLDGLRGGGERSSLFLERFVDFLLEHRSAVYVFINQSASLLDLPVIQRAMAKVELIARYFEEQVGSLEERVRFGVALGGAAYLLAGAPQIGPAPQPDLPELRSTLLAVLGDLLAIEPRALAAASDAHATID
ncbi:TetR/AcrR family transcriptional regulator [Lysinimonas soli]|uniref:TetR/AcrR family transcriptional regulator n=1 Tax=Lysinimonas soli TaxID=1074233 RepID=A0ABW0NT87_9MICO